MIPIPTSNPLLRCTRELTTMEDITMGMGGASQGNSEQPIHNNNIPLVASMDGSIFEPQPYNDVTIGHVGDSRNSVIPNLYLNFSNVASYLASNDNPSMENPVPNEHDQLPKLTLGPKVDPNIMDPKRLKKLELNRLSVQKCRNKKNQYVLDLEKQLRTIQERVITLQKQVESTTDHNQVLKSEKEELKQKVEALEKIISLMNDETEKYTAEVKVLREIYRQMEEPFGTPMLDWNADLNPMSSYPISDPVVVENDDATPEMMIDMPPNQDN